MTRNAWMVGALLLAAILRPVPLPAQPASAPPRAAVVATVGTMHPLEGAVRQLYAGAFVPVTVEADFRVWWKFFVFGGGQFLRKDGEVVFSLPPAPTSVSLSASAPRR